MDRHLSYDWSRLSQRRQLVLDRVNLPKVNSLLPSSPLCVELATLPVLGIRRGKKEDTKMRVTVVVNKDLTGVFTALFKPEDKLNKGEACVEFNGSPCGRQALGSYPSTVDLTL